jgi:AcrR family transcriptional regulator
MGTKRVRMSAEERKQEILRVAALVFAEKGYRLASITDIIGRAGIARGTFYLYFESKRDLFLELIQSYFEDFAKVLQDNHRNLEEALRRRGDFLAAWRENIVKVLEYHNHNQHLFSIVYREALGRDEDFSERVDELAGLARRIFLEEFKMLADGGLLRPCDIELVTSTVIGGTVFTIMEHLIGKEPVDVGNLADKILDYHVRALAPTGPNR